MNVSLFITCVSDTIFPDVGKATVQLLRHFGCNVDFPEDQTCCGQPAYNSGYHDDAKKAAQQLIRAFEDAEVVVTPSGSCAAMIRHYYPYLFATDDEWRDRAQQLVDKTYEFSEFLVRKLGITSVEARFPATATYHHSCHMLRGLGEAEAPLTLLSSVQDLQMIDLPNNEDCCGFGGTFAVKMHDISEQMVDEKCAHVAETEADILVSSDMACLMNIEGRLRRREQDVRIMHVAEILWEGVKNGEQSRNETV